MTDALFIAPIERRPQPKLERVTIPADVFTQIAVALYHISDRVLGLTQVVTRKVELTGDDLSHYAPFLEAINDQVGKLQEMLRACLDASSPSTEAYHG